MKLIYLGKFIGIWIVLMLLFKFCWERHCAFIYCLLLRMKLKLHAVKADEGITGVIYIAKK